MKNEEFNKVFFKELGFGNLNILKLPHTMISVEAGQLENAIDIAINSHKVK